jgi:protoporphyrinogen oxidase
MLDVPQVSRDSWLYVQDLEVAFGRFHEPGNWSRALVPDEQHTSLVLECFCTRGDEIWSLSDEDLVKRCVDDLVDKLQFLERENVIDSCVVRTVNVYPIYDLEYAHKTGMIKKALRAYDGLHIVGRGGTFRYNNSDHSIEMGLLLAQKLSGREVDHLAVNLEQEYQERRSSEGLQRDRFVSDGEENRERQSG